MELGIRVLERAMDHLLSFFWHTTLYITLCFAGLFGWHILFQETCVDVYHHILCVYIKEDAGGLIMRVKSGSDWRVL